MSPIRLLLFPVSVVCFLAAAVTDGLYGMSEYLMWLHFSEWLIAAGVAFGVATGVAFIVELLWKRAAGRWVLGRVHAWLFFIAVVIELVNSFVHTADGWTAIMPAGLALSIAGACVALASAGAVWLSPMRWEGPRRVWP
jgi:uncharacterized membrane protein